MRRERPTQTRRTRRAPATRRRQPSRRDRAMALGRGVSGVARRQQKSKASRKGPALLAVVAGLGAAGAAALKWRRSGADEAPGYFPPPEPVGEPTPVNPAKQESDPPTGVA
jgi:hypothetical protein